MLLFTVSLEILRGQVSLRPMIMKVAKEFEAEYPFGFS
jgi:hypothetical protein